MKQKNYLLYQGWLYVLIPIGFIILIASGGSETDTFGMLFGIAFSLFFAYKSYSYFKEAEKVADDKEMETNYAPSSDATSEEQIAYYRRMLILVAVTFPALTIMTHFDLSDLESGAIESVRLWSPIAFLYDLGGYWLAILIPLMTGICGSIILYKKIQDIKTN